MIIIIFGAILLLLTVIFIKWMYGTKTKIRSLCDEAETYLTAIHSVGNLTGSQRENIDMACDCLLEIKGEKELFE